MVFCFSALKGRSRKHREGRTYRGCFVFEEIGPAGYHSGKGKEEKRLWPGIRNIPVTINDDPLVDFVLFFLFLLQIWDLADPDGKGFLDKQVKHMFSLPLDCKSIRHHWLMSVGIIWFGYSHILFIRRDFTLLCGSWPAHKADRMSLLAV